MKSQFLVALFLSWSLPAFTQDASTAGCADCDLAKKDSLGKISAGIEQAAFNKLNFLDPELVESMDSRKLAEMLVQRLTENCDKLRDPELPPAESGESDIMMILNSNNLESIQKNGFRNQHQTSSTGGNNCKECRFDNEIGLSGIGMGYSNKTRELLPKFALHVFNNEKHGGSNIPREYGNMMVKFKPEVKKRTTWTSMNSLGTNSKPRTYNLKTPETLECSSYCESQIWGELDFSDVDSLYVYEDTEITSQMKSLNLPIYTVTRSSTERTGSLMGVKINKTPTFSPTGTPKARESRNVFQGRNELKGATNDALKMILKSDIYGKMSTNALIADIEKEPTVGKRPNILDYNDDYNAYFIAKENYRKNGNLSAPKIRMVAELATRSSDPKVIAQLKKYFSEDSVPWLKGVAITGLTKLPWSEYKPLLISFASVKDAGGIFGEDSFKRLKLQLLRAHADDAEIAGLLKTEMGTYTREEYDSCKNEKLNQIRF